MVNRQNDDGLDDASLFDGGYDDDDGGYDDNDSDYESEWDETAIQPLSNYGSMSISASRGGGRWRQPVGVCVLGHNRQGNRSPVRCLHRLCPQLPPRREVAPKHRSRVAGPGCRGMEVARLPPPASFRDRRPEGRVLDWTAGQRERAGKGCGRCVAGPVGDRRPDYGRHTVTSAPARAGFRGAGTAPVGTRPCGRKEIVEQEATHIDPAAHEYFLCRLEQYSIQREIAEDRAQGNPLIDHSNLLKKLHEGKANPAEIYSDSPWAMRKGHRSMPPEPRQGEPLLGTPGAYVRRGGRRRWRASPRKEPQR